MRGKSVMLLAGLASLAQANELNLYSVNTGSYVYHLTNNHGQYTENFENHFFSVERKFSADSKYSLLLGTMNKQLQRSLPGAGGEKRLVPQRQRVDPSKAFTAIRRILLRRLRALRRSWLPIKTLRTPRGSAFHPISTHAIQYNFTDYFAVESGNYYSQRVCDQYPVELPLKSSRCRLQGNHLPEQRTGERGKGNEHRQDKGQRYYPPLGG
ncbi:Uncharacterised protein [Klebsiella pneumoniae subsp. ozaenae]|uniref:Uncharacterized protein n=2 Tax=Gammaproteobacteria TaxID=1236 RepID=A0A378BS42_KLEPO|nr:Uncharacterised protein [Klebsiella pneumoniae subsp. ozaenae]